MRKMDLLTGSVPCEDARDVLDPSLAETAFFFDVDGTLLEIAAEPGDVVADQSLRDLLTCLIGRTNGAVALVSGRTLSDLDRIFEPLKLPTAALHGSEIRFPDGSHAAPPEKLMDHARSPVRNFVAKHAGLMLEDKGATLAVHFRRRPDLASTVVTFLNGLGAGDEVEVQEGKFVAELKSTRFGKGAAIAALMEHAPFSGRTPAFYGDDLTDESGFALVNRLGGVAVRIGDPEARTQARFRFGDPSELRRHLRLLLAARADSSGARAP